MGNLILPLPFMIACVVHMCVCVRALAFYLVLLFFFVMLKHCSADTVNRNENQHVVTALSVESLPRKSLLWFWAVTLPKCLRGISEKQQV